MFLKNKTLSRRFFNVIGAADFELKIVFGTK